MKTVLLVFLFSINIFSAGYSHYFINAGLDVEKHVIEGEESINFINKFSHPIKEIYFVLSPNLQKKKNPYVSQLVNDMGYENGFEPGYIEIEEVTGRGHALKYSYEKGLDYIQTYSTDEALLRVKLFGKLAPGKTINLRIKFKTYFPEKKGDEAHFQGMYLWRYGWFPVELQIKNNKWHSGYSPSPFTYNAEIKVPREYSLVAGGDRVAIKRTMQKLAGRKEKEDMKTYELSSRSFVVSLPICVANDLTTFQTRVDGVRIRIHVREEGYWFLDKSHRPEALEMLRYAKEILRYYNRNFGRYKFKKLEIIESTEEGAGMAADGFVLMPEIFFAYKNMLSPGIMERYLEHVLAHEIAHSYWGLGVNLNFARDNWISEAMAQYLSITFLEDKYGPYNNVFTPGPLFTYTLYYYFNKTYGLTLPSDHRKDLIERPYRRSVKDGLDEGVIKKIKDVKHTEDLNNKWYKKGYLVVRAMENIVGRAQFHNILRRIFETSNGYSYTPEMLIEWIKNQTGKDLRPFAKNWFYSGKTVDYSINSLETKRSKRGHENIVTVKNSGTGTMPCDLVLYGVDGVVAAHRRISVAPGKETKFKIDTTGDVEKAVVDEREYIPDINRKNNFYPRKGISTGFIFDKVSTDENYLTFDLYLLSAMAFELRGGYLDDYRWSLMGGYRFYDETGGFYYGRAGGQTRIGREKQIYTQVSYNAWSKDRSKYYYTAALGISIPIFTEINLGQKGRMTTPRDIITTGVTYVNFEHIRDSVSEDFSSYEIDDKEYNINLSYTRNDLVKLAWLNRLSLNYYVNSESYRGKLTSQKHFKPFGRLLFSVTGEYGYASKNIPEFYKFNLDYLNIYRYKRTGQAFINGRLEAMLKLYRARKTRVLGRAEKYIPCLNFLMYEGLNIGAFIQASDVYDMERTGETLDYTIVGGPELQLLNSTFLAMPFDLKFIYSIPIKADYDSDSILLLRAGMRF